MPEMQEAASSHRCKKNLVKISNSCKKWGIAETTGLGVRDSCIPKVVKLILNERPYL